MKTNIILKGDCIEKMRELEDNSVDAIVTDPPYGIGFMGKEWDNFKPSTIKEGMKKDKRAKTQIASTRISNIAGTYDKSISGARKYQEFCEMWSREALRILKPGGYMLVSCSTRMYHRMTCGIEDAGFEIRDTIMWLYGCLSKDTEILTDKGFKGYNEISEKDIVYSFNLKSKEIERSKVENIFIYNHNGKMINLKNDNTNQLLTPNHKVICKEALREQSNYDRKLCESDNWSWQYAQQIKNYGYYRLPLGAVYNGFLSCGVDFAELLGWILSEGGFQGNAINIYQSSVNKEKVDMIRDLLKRLDIKHSEYKRKRKHKNKDYVEHQFYFSGGIVKKIKDWIPNKKPTTDLWNLTYEEKIALFNSLMFGDGSKKGKGNYITFYQEDLEFLEWFQVLCHLIGKQARINKKKMSVEVHHNQNTQLQARHLKNRIKNYNGIVWSIKTNNMSYIARRKGKIFITGNSGFPKSMDIGQDFDRQECRKQLTKKLGRKPTRDEFKKEWENFRKVIGKIKRGDVEKAKIKGVTYASAEANKNNSDIFGYGTENITIPKTPEAKQWEGWGTALKPACEPIVVARKPLSEKNVALNVLKWGTGGINIDGCRIGTTTRTNAGKPNTENNRIGAIKGYVKGQESMQHNYGRFPANIILDEEAGEMLDEQSGITKSQKVNSPLLNIKGNNYGRAKGNTDIITERGFNDKGGASRFFYCAKASKSERNFGCEELGEKPIDIQQPHNSKDLEERYAMTSKNNHPTVKPIKLMEYLVKLVSKKGATILDPFLGSGTTAIACVKLNRNFIGIEKEEEYIKIINARIKPYIK